MNAYPDADWIEKAEGNYVSALSLMRQRTRKVYDVVCNQCQQCAEKYLKAFLVRHSASFPKTHDLIQLEDLTAAIDPDFRLLHQYLSMLNIYGIDIRYPGLDATAQDAREAVAAMKTIRKITRSKLGLRSK